MSANARVGVDESISIASSTRQVQSTTELWSVKSSKIAPAYARVPPSVSGFAVGTAQSRFAPRSRDQPGMGVPASASMGVLDCRNTQEGQIGVAAVVEQR